MTDRDDSGPPEDDYVHQDSDAPGFAPPERPAFEMRGMDAPLLTQSPSIFCERWVTLSDRPSVLIEAPPPQKWLFTRYQDERDIGVFPRGKTGLLTGTGGTGKTYALAQLALAVAIGGFWFDTFRVPQPGHVLLALAEEELDEVTRRLWRVCNALELSADERRDAAQRIHVLPLHGVPVSLLHSSKMGVYEETQAAAEFQTRLQTFGFDLDLVVLDPLSRWAGAGAERDNEAATRFIQVVERVSAVRGNPSVLLAHHSSKISVGTGTSDARGVTGLRDAVRWMASLDAVKSANGRERAVRLRNDKSNYSPEFDDLLLVRSSAPGCEGTLRRASSGEADNFTVTESGRNKARQDKARDSFGANCELVLAQLPLSPGHKASGAVEAALRALGRPLSDKTLKGILQHLASEAGCRRAIDLSNGAQSKPRQWARTPGATP